MGLSHFRLDNARDQDGRTFTKQEFNYNNFNKNYAFADGDPRNNRGFERTQLPVRHPITGRVCFDNNGLPNIPAHINLDFGLIIQPPCPSRQFKKIY